MINLTKFCNLIKNDRIYKTIIIILVISLVCICFTLSTLEHFDKVMCILSLFGGKGRGCSSTDISLKKSDFRNFFLKKEIIIAEVLLFILSVIVLLLNNYKCNKIN